MHADAFRSRAQLRVRRMRDLMIAVANDASRKPGMTERPFYAAFFVHLRLEYMAIGADILDRIHARRSRPMVSMARRASGSTQIAAYRHGFVVHACAVLRKLVRRNAIGFHVRSVGVAA